MQDTHGTPVTRPEYQTTQRDTRNPQEKTRDTRNPQETTDVFEGLRKAQFNHMVQQALKKRKEQKEFAKNTQDEPQDSQSVLDSEFESDCLTERSFKLFEFKTDDEDTRDTRNPLEDTRDTRNPLEETQDTRNPLEETQDTFGETMYRTALEQITPQNTYNLAEKHTPQKTEETPQPTQENPYRAEYSEISSLVGDSDDYVFVPVNFN